MSESDANADPGGPAFQSTIDTDEQLARAIAATALLHGRFTLRSGRQSRYCLDKYRFETDPTILAALARRFAERIPAEARRLAGAELGGVPLVTAASLATGKPTVLIRDQKKGYGTAQQVEGLLEPDDPVVFIEDVVTTAGQAIEAIKVLRAAGARVLKVIAVIDREEGGRENLEAAGLTFEALFTKRDLGVAE